jgi:anti-anti-sigma regulatory factor
MSILNLNTPQGRGPVSKKSAKIWMGVGLLAAVLGFGSTFAANITLNNGNSPTEFGQGVQRTVYCGDTASTLTLKPISTFKSSTNSFAVAGISVSGIPLACKSLNFVISVFKDGSDTRQTIASKDTSSLITPTVYWTDTLIATNVFDPSYRTSSYSCQAKKTGSSLTTTTGGALLSLSTTSYVDPCKVGYLSSVTPSNRTTGGGAFTLTVSSSVDSLMSLVDFDKITIETQADTFGLSSTTSPSGLYGLVNN